MLTAILFALLVLCLSGFREGVWRRYTPAEIARWHTEALPQTPSALLGSPARPVSHAALAAGESSPERRELVREAA